MRALRLAGERQIVVRECPDPIPGAGEVVIRMRAAGICGSDLHPYRHPPPTILENDVIPGHEPCGEVVALGSSEFSVPLMRLVHREIAVFGTSMYPDTLFPEICRFVRDHGIPLDAVVSHTFSLDQGPEAFRIADSATTGKVMFRFE